MRSPYSGRVLDFGIDLDVWPWVWLVTAVVFALVELIFVGGSFIILPWAISAFIAALLGFYDVPIEIQWAEFVLGGAGLFAVLLRWAQRVSDDSVSTPGVGAGRLVGLTGIVTTAIDPDDTDRKGRVTVLGEVWGALAADDGGIPIGAKVKVLSMQGTRIVVEPAATAADEASVAGGKE
jgi:membrane protein implicated in regulation of membrane protease activity